ncbi:MAG: hypothetical protein EOP91_07020 [Lysobacteraceae bacterium]|nr:MAG: hypothetical protein EOP91_07020 [Xanthomonadaceae bacterium]
MTTRPPSPWDQASLRSADARKRENAERRREAAPAAEARAPARPDAGNRQELRCYGLNAVQAIFAQRPESIRKVYLAESRIPQLQPLLAWCVKQRVGYRVVEEADLGKLAASSHHEGVVADVLRAEAQDLQAWLQSLPAGPVLALWLDGVGNPHNFGAILRSAAHFGVAAILQSHDSSLALSGAAARVAEGGAERVPLVRMGERVQSLALLREAGFQLAATVVRPPWPRKPKRGRPSSATLASRGCRAIARSAPRRAASCRRWAASRPTPRSVSRCTAKPAAASAAIAPRWRCSPRQCPTCRARGSTSPSRPACCSWPCASASASWRAASSCAACAGVTPFRPGCWPRAAAATSASRT